MPEKANVLNPRAIHFETSKRRTDLSGVRLTTKPRRTGEPRTRISWVEQEATEIEDITPPWGQLF